MRKREKYPNLDIVSIIQHYTHAISNLIKPLLPKERKDEDFLAVYTQQREREGISF